MNGLRANATLIAGVFGMALIAGLGVIEDGQREIRAELKPMRIQLQAVQVDIGNVYETTGTMDNRIGRIERRLDLSEAPVQ